MGKKKTHEEYVLEVANINPNIEVVGLYNGDRVPILHKCKLDGYEWNPYPTNILKGSGCPLCGRKTSSKKRSRTHNQYVEEVAGVNKNIDVVGVYKNIDTPILHKCRIDGYEWLVSPYNILKGHGCPMCAEVKKPTTDEFIKKMSYINPNIDIIGNYINNNTGILCRCKVDEYIWTPTPSNLLAGKGCPVCGGVKKRTTDEYINEVHQINLNIEVLGEYINAVTPILHRCRLDKTEWFAQPNHILSGHGCPVCNCSIGEKTITKYLEYNNILFISQHTFNDCKNKKKLPFDFYLPEYNACIEYDGLQHFEVVDFFGGDDGFKKRQYNDSIKTAYCELNNIQLLRIRYDQNIEDTLNVFFNDTKLIKEVS